MTLKFFDVQGYIESIKDHAISQASSIFCTIHCPDNKYLLASSNQGRIAIWDLSIYLFPSNSDASALSNATNASSSTNPIFSKHGLKKFEHVLKLHEARLYPQQLIRKGIPRLSFQASTRAVNKIVFTHEQSANPLLVLGGDDGIYIWSWKSFLSVLDIAAPDDIQTIDLGSPLCHLKAFSSQKAFPFTTESNQVSTTRLDPRLLYSACGDAAVRVWDLEKQVCDHVMVGHAGYVHTVKDYGANIVSGGEDGKVAIWDVRQAGSLVKMIDIVEEAESFSQNTATSSLSKTIAGDMNNLRTARWISALDIDRDENFLVVGGGVDSGGSSNFGFVSVLHLPSFSVVSSSSTQSYVQDVKFYNEKIISVGNESIASHWSRPRVEAGASHVQTLLPSIFSINARDGPPHADGVTVYAGAADVVTVYVHPENCAFNLKFR